MKPSDCSRCPHSFVCMIGNAALMAHVKRMLCDFCHRQWIRFPVEGGWRTLRCTDNHVGLPDPEPWVCYDCVEDYLRTKKLNDDDRSQWIDNDEGLYDAWRRSGLSKREFIRRNRSMLTEVITNVRENKKPAHYLKYGG